VEDVRRAQVILKRAEGVSVRGVATLLGCSTSYVQRLTKRFKEARLGGLLALYKGRRSSQNAAKRAARILEWT
jgi:transposase